QEQITRELARAGGALAGAVETVDEGYDLGDRVVLVRTTRFSVNDPAAVRRASPTLNRFMASRRTPASTNALSLPDVQAGLARARQEYASRPPNDPLRRAAEQGDAQLVAAITSGVGEMEVIDTFVLPTQPMPENNGVLQLPVEVDGRWDYARLRNGGLQPLRPTTAVSPLQTGVTSQVGVTASVQTIGGVQNRAAEGGVLERTYEFLSGFTWGRTWEWERRWNYASGFFRVSFKAGLGFGVRIPSRATVRMSPQSQLLVGVREQDAAFNTEVSFETVDGDADFYRRAGLASSRVFEGNELVMQATAGFGYKFRALWHDWAHEPLRERGFDYNQNFRAPMSANWSPVAEVFVPPNLTRSEVNLGVMGGSASIGVQLAAKGRVRATYRSLIQGQVAPSMTNNLTRPEHTLEWANPGQPLRFVTALPVPPNPSVTQSRTYGFELGDVHYTTDWSLVPGIRVNFWVGVHAAGEFFGRTFETTVWLDSFRIHLGNTTLGPHDGTTRWRRDEGGRRNFRQSVGAVSNEGG
ncbi:MAG: hypothetical protein R3B99_21330, partial [Polyangiales bacterium]